ncbi:SDR family NAD(P)-dependent oxidoreductase [Propionibacteriaceae bacterium Y2011]
MTSPGRLEGRRALITGASRGIGAAVARRFAAEGASVIVSHEPIPERAAEAGLVVSEIQAAGGSAIAAPADLLHPEQITALVDTAAQWAGGLDIVVANAAMTGRAVWHEMSVDEWDRMQAVNVRGTYLLAKHAHRFLCDSEHASFIAVTSVMAETGLPGALHYTTSKAAIIGLVRGLAFEVGADGIRVNAVMPGAIRTEHEVELAPDGDVVTERWLKRQALQRRGYADDLAGAFLFLAGDDSDFISGQIVNVDGGWVLR